MSALREASVEGTVSLMLSEEGSDCVCCPGSHCFSRGVTVDAYEGEWPHRTGDADAGDFVNDFVSRLWREHGYALDGRRVRVSVELLP